MRLFLVLAQVVLLAGRMEAQSFELKPRDVVVFTGGEAVVEMQKNGYLELLLTLYQAEGVRFRYMGWEGDTVYEQLRPLNFPGWEEQLRRVDASVVFAQFGQSESFQGEGALPQFVAAYERLLDQWAKEGRRLVLVSPTPFETMLSPMPDLAWRNADLKVYVEAIRKLAERRGLDFVDLFSSFSGAKGSVSLTRNGMHLNAPGHWLAASEILRQLGWVNTAPEMIGPSAEDRLAHPRFEKLRQTITAKNQFWFDYWRPMNWAFLAGDRIEQPSSRDHRDLSVRWFPEEMEQFLPLIREKEEEISSLAAGLPGFAQ